MLIMIVITIFQIKDLFYRSTIIDLAINNISCNILDIFFDSNITFSCDSQYNSSLQNNEMEDMEIFAVNSINIINNSNVNYDNIDMQNISINTVGYTEITFIEFFDITIIDQIITNLSFSYENVLITLEWNKYQIRKSNNCIWDYPSLSQSNNNIKMFVEIPNRNDKFKKLCMNGQAYLHYLEKPSIQNIIISKRTMVICVIIIVVIIVIFIISLYFVALWKYNKDILHQSSIKENGSSSRSNENRVNSIENEKSVEENQDINIIKTPNGNVNRNDDESIDNEDINHNNDLNEQMKNKQEKDNNQSFNENDNSNLNDQNHSEKDDVDLHSQSYDDNINTELNNQCNNENKNSVLYNPNHSENDNAFLSDHNNDLNEELDEISDHNDESKNLNIKEVIDDSIVLSDQNEISNNNEKSQKDKKCKNTVFIMFLTHLFECGNSAGSIITEAFELFKTFQRFSGTQTFSIHFSKDCLKMFSWATSIFESILSNFYIGTFSEIELFYLINYIVPMLIITFVVSFMWNRNFYIILIFCGICFVLGFSFAYVKYDRKISIALIVVFLIIFILIIIFFITHDGFMQFFLALSQSYADRPAFLPFSFSISNTLLIISIMLLPFFLYNSYLIGSYFFICLILFILGIIIDLILMKYFKIDDIYDFFADRITYLFINFLSLLFIYKFSIIFIHIFKMF